MSVKTLTTLALSMVLLSPGATGWSQRQKGVVAEESGTPILVELFTSEGCSSCPPADELLRRIEGKAGPAGRLIVGISEHVTYWNQLGWSDPFSSSVYTQRQEAYGRRFGLGEVYTPQMVINGEDQIVGNDGAGLLRALQKEPTKTPVSVQIRSANLHGDGIEIAFSVQGDLPKRGIDIFAVLADDVDESSVSRGENAGRRLQHVAVARSMVHAELAAGSVNQTLSLPLGASLKLGNQKRHVILFAQTKELGSVVGVATKAI